VIIDCICGKKKFKVSEDQIPQEGRKVQCGSCSQVWFYTPPPIQYVEDDEVISQNNLQQQLQPETNETAYDNKTQDIIKITKVRRADKNYNLRMGIYLTFLILICVSIILVPYKNKVVMIFPFLKGYLDLITKIVLKLYKILKIF